MVVPEKLVRIAKEFEGFYAEPYFCPGGYKTIGYGHLLREGEQINPPITEEEAHNILIADLKNAVAAAYWLSPVLRREPEDRLVAIADFIFNLGSSRYKASTLRYYVNTLQWVEASVQIQRWIYAGGRVMPGLIRRRRLEAKLLLEPASDLLPDDASNET